MRTLPRVPGVADAPPSLLDGHLWLQEYVTGGWLRVQLRDSGLLVFGDDDSEFDGDPPLAYRWAVRHVREQFDRDALRAALDDVETAVFYGLATRHEGVAYDWARVPPFLLVDAYDASDDRFLPPDAVDALADSLGLATPPAVAKEVRGADFDPEQYEIPESAYRDGPAAGVLVRNKTGDRALLRAPATEDADAFDDADAAADALVTPARVDRASETVTAGGADEVAERVFELVAREAHARLFGPDANVDADVLRRAVGERTRRHLDAA